MAINFPNTPSHGNTYDYLGVRYTFNKAVGTVGFWQVTTPGSFGVASAAEIDLGTDTVKYVTPLELELSGYTKDLASAAQIDAGSGIGYFVTPPELAASDYMKDPGDLLHRAEYGEYTVDGPGLLEYVSGLSPSWKEIDILLNSVNMGSIGYMTLRFNSILGGYDSAYSNMSRTSQHSSTQQFYMGYFTDGNNIYGKINFKRFGAYIYMDSILTDEGSNDPFIATGRFYLGGNSGRNFDFIAPWVAGNKFQVVQKK